jgi:NAD(P)H-flavin reductase
VALLEGAALTEAARRPVHLLMGARTQQDLYYEPQLAALAALWQAPFHYVPVLSEEPAGSDWAGARGWVTDAITPAACAGAQGYLCGPPPMIDAAIAVMTGHGIAPDRIFFDKFSDQSAT